MTSTAHERATDRLLAPHNAKCGLAAFILTLRNLKHIRRVYKLGRRMHLHLESFNAMRVIQ